MTNRSLWSTFVIDVFIILGAIMIPDRVLNIVKQYNNATGGVALVYPKKGLISLKKCRPIIKWKDAVKKMESAINSHQYETAVRGMGHRDTGNHLGTIVSCDNYPFCACDLE